MFIHDGQSFTVNFMHRLCYALNQCTTLKEVHLNMPYNGISGCIPTFYPEFSFILSPTISRCTHITLGVSSSARLFALHTLAPISASCGLSHLSLQLPWEKFVQGKPRGLYWNELGRMLQTIKQEAANQVTSLSLRSRSSVVSFEDFWSKLVGKFVKIKSLRLHLLPAFAHVSLFKK